MFPHASLLTNNDGVIFGAFYNSQIFEIHAVTNRVVITHNGISRCWHLPNRIAESLLLLPQLKEIQCFVVWALTVN